MSRLIILMVLPPRKGIKKNNNAGNASRCSSLHICEFLHTVESGDHVWIPKFRPTQSGGEPPPRPFPVHSPHLNHTFLRPFKTGAPETIPFQPSYPFCYLFPACRSCPPEPTRASALLSPHRGATRQVYAVPPLSPPMTDDRRQPLSSTTSVLVLSPVGIRNDVAVLQSLHFT